MKPAKQSPDVRARVEGALANGEACWCAMVRLELWNGAAGERDRKALKEFERLVPNLRISDEIWSEAAELARRARAKAITVPASDLLIAACARHHGAKLETADSDFDLLARL